MDRLYQLRADLKLLYVNAAVLDLNDPTPLLAKSVGVEGNLSTGGIPPSIIPATPPLVLPHRHVGHKVGIAQYGKVDTLNLNKDFDLGNALARVDGVNVKNTLVISPHFVRRSCPAKNLAITKPLIQEFVQIATVRGCLPRRRCLHAGLIAVIPR